MRTLTGKEDSIAEALDDRTLGRRRAGWAVALFFVLAVASTWPLAWHLGNSTPSVHRDARITAWLLAWDAHALRTDPTELFQAPIFFPERDTLAYSDHMIGLGIFAAPVTWLSGDLYVGHNVVYILSIAFAASAATLLAFELTGHYAASLLAGAAFGFAPYWSNHEMHIQILAAGWIPLAIFGLIRWLRTERPMFLAVATGGAVMASLTSWYQAAFVLVAAIVVAAVLLAFRRPARPVRMAVHALAAIAIGGAVLWPFAVPYLRVQDRHPTFTRHLADIKALSARPQSYLAAPPSNLIYGRITSRWSGYPDSVELNLLPGIGVVFLAASGIATRRNPRGERGYVLAAALLVIVSVILAFGAGPTGIRRHLPWAFLSDHVVLFRALRAAARMHVLTILGLSMLAAFGLRRLVASSGRRGTVVAVVLFSLVVAEGASVPLALGPSPGGQHPELASREGGVLELPIGRRFDADTILQGTAHWRPLANGISGYTPQSYKDLLQALERADSAQVLGMLRARGVRTVILDMRRLGSQAASALMLFRGQPGVRELMHDRTATIFDVSSGAR